MGELIDLDERRKARDALVRRRARALREAELKQRSEAEGSEEPRNPGRDGGAGQA